jgi:nucleoside-diphosphate-sugar epimerase
MLFYNSIRRSTLLYQRWLAWARRAQDHRREIDMHSSIVITGTQGNLGGKLLRHLVAQPGYTRLVGLDLREAPESLRRELDSIAAPGVEIVLQAADLSDWQDRRWHEVLAGADAVVHFATPNPWPDSGWEVGATAFTMAHHIARAAVENGVRRIVYASSNHVMGRYRNQNLGPGELTPDLYPGVGTQWMSQGALLDATPYAASHLAREWLLKSLAAQQDGGLEAVIVRVGWNQPGENLPSNLWASGVPGSDSYEDPEAELNADWFRTMWLSNRDLVQLFERALQAASGGWPGPAIVVNGVSDNTGTRWSLDEARQYLGYAPQDDVARGD